MATQSPAFGKPKGTIASRRARRRRSRIQLAKLVVLSCVIGAGWAALPNEPVRSVSLVKRALLTGRWGIPPSEMLWGGMSPLLLYHTDDGSDDGVVAVADPGDGRLRHLKGPDRNPVGVAEVSGATVRIGILWPTAQKRFMAARLKIDPPKALEGSSPELESVRSVVSKEWSQAGQTDFSRELLRLLNSAPVLQERMAAQESRPIPSGYLLNAASVGVLAAWCFVAFRSKDVLRDIPHDIRARSRLRTWRKLESWRIARTRCAQCGYDLSDNVGGVCPECGWARSAGAE